jgi:hypothetical protein
MRKIILFVLLFPITSYAFEYLDYSSGMSKEVVKSLLSRQYKNVNERDGGELEVADPPNWMTFGFCKGKLNQINVGWKADIPQLVILSSQFEKKYGVSRNYHASVNSLNSAGTQYGLESWWNKGKDWFGIMYNSYDTAKDSMTVVYETRDSCFK